MAGENLSAETDAAIECSVVTFSDVKRALRAIVAELRQRRSGAEEQRTNVQPSFTGIGGIVAPSPSEPVADRCVCGAPICAHMAERLRSREKQLYEVRAELAETGKLLFAEQDMRHSTTLRSDRAESERDAWKERAEKAEADLAALRSAPAKVEGGPTKYVATRWFVRDRHDDESVTFLEKEEADAIAARRRISYPSEGPHVVVPLYELRTSVSEPK